MRALFIFFVLAMSSYTACAAPISTARIAAELTRWEGYRLSPYRDKSGWTVGVGHNLTAHKKPVKSIYTRAEVRDLFYKDLAIARDAARAGVRDFDDLPEDVQALTLGLIWTVGRKGFMRFKNFRLALSYRFYNSAHAELAASKWVTQVQPARVKWSLGILQAQ